MKINQKDYKYWVVVAGKIVGGNEYREDALEFMNDINSDIGRWPHLGMARTYARAGLKRLGLNPDVNSDWGEPAEWRTAANPAGIPFTVERYFRETTDKNPDMPPQRAWAIAWSRYCKYKDPGSSHCRMSRQEYFPGRGGEGSGPLPNPAQIIAFPVSRSRAITLNAESAGLVSEYMGNQVEPVLVMEGSELAVAFDPGTLLIFPGPGATMGTQGSLARMGATVDENGAVVGLDRADKFHASLSSLLAARVARPEGPPRSTHFPVAGVPDDFQRALDEYMAFAQSVIDKEYQRYANVRAPVLTIQDGRRYVRVVRGDGVSSSAHVFIDKLSGDILKPASWKGPTKGARGNILARNYQKWVTPSGAAYLR